MQAAAAWALHVQAGERGVAGRTHAHARVQSHRSSSCGGCGAEVQLPRLFMRFLDLMVTFFALLCATCCVLHDWCSCWLTQSRVCGWARSPSSIWGPMWQSCVMQAPSIACIYSRALCRSGSVLPAQGTSISRGGKDVRACCTALHGPTHSSCRTVCATVLAAPPCDGGLWLCDPALGQLCRWLAPAAW